MKIVIDMPDNVVKELKGAFLEMPDSLLETSLKIGFMNATKEIYVSQPQTVEWAKAYLHSDDVKSAMVDILKIAADLIEINHD